MNRFSLLLTAVVLVTWTLAAPVYAQQVPRRNVRPRPPVPPAKPKYPPLPDDKRLLSLHLEFVKKAEVLAKEYERQKEWDKARDVYREILKLVPAYGAAREKLDEMGKREATAQRATCEVHADRAWQPSGVKLIAGKPFAIKASGTWTFKLSSRMGPDGIQIPKELRDFNLGCLVATIDTGNPKEYKPFVVGAEYSGVASRSGQLVFRMYDIEPADNDGILQVQIIGTFQGGKKVSEVTEKE